MRRPGRAVAVRVLLVAALLGFAAPAPSPAAEEDRADFRERFDHMKKVFVLARTAARDIPADTFDLDAVLKETGDSTRAIRDWVAKNTAWVPYRGALRGPHGVLMDRVGNHLDRALLVAELLRRADHEVRIERGVIPAEKVDALLASLADPTEPPEPEEPDEEALRAHLAEVARILDEPLESIEKTFMRSRLRGERLLEELTRRTALAVPRLSEAFGTGAEADSDAEVREILADHFRAAVKRGDQWLPCDPLAASIDGGDPLFEEIRETAVPGELPEAWRHRMTIRVEAERWSGGELSREAALVHEMDAADLLAETPALTLKALDWPLDLPKVTLDPDQMTELAERTRKAFLEQEEWLPILDLEKSKVHQKSFLADGRIVDKPSISLESRKLRTAKGALGALGTAGGDEGELTAVFVVVEIRGPGGESFSTERAWIDLIGPARRAAGVPGLELSDEDRRGRAVGLGGAMNFLALPCGPSMAWLARQRLDALLRNRVPILGALYAGMRDEGDDVSKYLNRGRPAPMELYSLVGNRTLGPGSEDLFVDGLNVVASFTRPVLVDGALGLSQGLDLVRVTHDARPGAKRSAAAARFAQGVKDTVAEALTLPRTLGARKSAAESFARALAAGREWVLLRDPEEVGKAAIALSDDSRERVRRALRDGREVLAPPTGGDAGVWWEHDPATGSVLGRTAGGHGGATEEIVILANDAFSLIMTLKGVLSCRGMSDLEMACCLLQNAAFGGYGLSVGASLGKAGLDLWGVAFNVAYTAATNEINLCGGG